MQAKTVKVAVLVSGGGTNLQALIDAKNNGKLNRVSFELVVSSNAEAYALVRAQKAGIPTVTVSKKQYLQAFEQRLTEVLDEYGIELIVLAGYLTILSPNFVQRYKDRIINIHPSLIPSFCGEGFYGLKVHEAVLERGVKVTGATAHFVNDVVDGGRIILQKAVRVLKKDNPSTLQKRVMQQAEWIILPKAVQVVCSQILKEKE